MPKLSTEPPYKLCWISKNGEMELKCSNPDLIIEQMQHLTDKGIASLAYVDGAPAIYSNGKLQPSQTAA